MSQRLRQPDALLVAFDWDLPHCRQVRDLAVSIFDQLAEPFRLHRSARDLLHAAALLHDIGWTIGHDKHHKHAYRLIHESKRGLSAFTAHEVELIANIARYHRKALPALKHEPFAALPDDDRQRVRQLAGILRVADGLDRPHLQLVRGVRCAVDDHTITLQVDVTGDVAAHLEGGARKRELLELAFRRDVRLICPGLSNAPRRS